jgi:predicted nucleic acid-binding protein
MSANLEGRLFLDTNILVYAFDRSAGQKLTIASQVVENCWQNNNGCLSIQVLQEFYVVVTRKLPTPIPLPAARQLVEDLSLWQLHTPYTSDIIQGIDIHHQYKISFWDAMIIQSAMRMGCDLIVSEDLQHNQTFGSLRIVNPFKVKA